MASSSASHQQQLQSTAAAAQIGRPPHADSLRDRLLCLKEDASALLVREFLAPYLDALQPHSLNNYAPYVDQPQLFAMLRLFHRDRGDAPSAGPSARRGLTFTPEENEDILWGYMCDIADSIFSDAAAEPREAAPEGCLAFSDLRTMAVLNTDGVVTGRAQRAALAAIVEREVAETGRDVISRTRFVMLLKAATAVGSDDNDDYEDTKNIAEKQTKNSAEKRTKNSAEKRTKNQHQKPLRFPCLARLDFEPLAFYLFPEQTAPAAVLLELIGRTHKPPAQQSFVTDYCAARAEDGYRLIDLAWSVPFFILFVIVCVTFKGVSPDGYDAYSTAKGTEERLLGASFPHCSLTNGSRSGSWTLPSASSAAGADLEGEAEAALLLAANGWDCTGSSSLMRATDVASADGVYSYILGLAAPFVWSAPFANMSAAETNVSNALRPVGALKIRQVRVKPSKEADPLLEGYYFSDTFYPNGSSSSHPYNSSNAEETTLFARLFRYGAYRGTRVDKRPLLATAAAMGGNSSSSSSSSLASASVVGTWDGSRYGSCSDLNASKAYANGYLSSTLSDERRYGCGGHAVVVPFNSTRAGLYAVVTALAASQWIDPLATRAVTVEYQLFHPYSGLFVSVGHLFEATAGGGGPFAARLAVTPFFFRDDTVSQSRLLTAGYIIVVVYFILLTLRLALGRLFPMVGAGGASFLPTASGRLWALYDAATHAVILSSIVIRFLWFTQSRAAASPVWQIDHYPSGYDYTAFLFRTTAILEAFSVLLLSLGLARYCSFADSLYGTVVRTASATAWLCATLGVLMVSVTFIFAVAGTAAFGPTVVGFETVKSSAMALTGVYWGQLGALFNGGLEAYDRFFGFLFFATFALISVGLLFAMFPAIFTNTYMDVQTAEARVSAALVDAVLRSDSHHLLDGGTVASRIASFPPLQLVIALLTRIGDACGCFASKTSSSPPPAASGASRRRRRAVDGEDDGGEEDKELKAFGGNDEDGTDGEENAFAALLARRVAGPDRFTFDVYNSRVGDMLLSLLQPNGDALSGRRAAASVTERTTAAAELLTLIAVGISVPTFDPSDSPATASSSSSSASVSVFDYAKEVLGNHLDYAFVMAFYVLIPQEKFAQIGGLSLLDAMKAHREWVDDVRGRSAQTSTAERLQLRIDVMLATQREAAAAAATAAEDQRVLLNSSTANSGNSNTPASVAAARVLRDSYTFTPPPVGVEEAALCDSMSHLCRRVFLGILSFAQSDEHYDDEGNVLSLERFADIAYSLQGYPSQRYSAAKLWADLGIEAHLMKRRRQEACVLKKAGLLATVYEASEAFADAMGGADAYSDTEAEAALAATPEEDMLPDPPNLFMRAFIPLFQREYAVQCFGCALGPDEALAMDALLRRAANANAERAAVPSHSHLAAASTSVLAIGNRSSGTAIGVDDSSTAQMGQTVPHYDRSHWHSNNGLMNSPTEGSMGRPLNVGGDTAPPSPINDDGAKHQPPPLPLTRGGAYDDGGLIFDPSAVAAGGNNANNSNSLMANTTTNQYGHQHHNNSSTIAAIAARVSYPFVTRRQFERAWSEVVGDSGGASSSSSSTSSAVPAPPPLRLITRIFRLMPDGVLDPALFLHYCRGNPMAAGRASLEAKFARQMSDRSGRCARLMLYVPLLVLMVYFILVGVPMDEGIAVSEGIRRSLAPRPFGSHATSSSVSGGIGDAEVHSLEDVRSFLRASVASIWGYDVAANGISNASLGLGPTDVPTAAAATDGAQPIAGANYPIGAVRLRQIRVRSDERKRCNDIFSTYFGDGSDSTPSNRQIAFPPSMAAAAREFYTARIGAAYEDIVNGACFSAWDKGDRELKLKLYNITRPSLVPSLGMRYTNTTGTATAAPQAGYHPGGFVMDVPVATPRAVAMSYLEELLHNYYIDRMTRFVVVEVVTYNPNVRLNAFSRFGFELTSGGAMVPIAEVFVDRHDGYPSDVFGVCTALIWVIVGLYACLLASDVAHIVVSDEALFLRSTIGAVIATFFGHPWLLVDAFVIVGFLVTWGWRATAVGRTDVDSIENAGLFADSAFAPPASSYAVPEAASSLWLGLYPIALEAACVFSRTIRNFDASLLLFAFARFYSLVAAVWPPLGVFYSVYRRAAKDLAGLLALLLLILIAFTVAALLLFGHSVDDLFTFESAYAAVFSTALMQNVWSAPIGGSSGTGSGSFSSSSAAPSSHYYAEAFWDNASAAFMLQLLLVVVTVFYLFGMTVAVLAGAVSAELDDAYDPDQSAEVLASEANAMRGLYGQHYEGSSDDSDGDDDEEDSDGGDDGSDSESAVQQRRAAARRHRAHVRARRAAKKKNSGGGIGATISSAFVRAFGAFMTSPIVREPIQLYYSLRLFCSGGGGAMGGAPPRRPKKVMISSSSGVGDVSNNAEGEGNYTTYAYAEDEDPLAAIPYSTLYCSSERAMWANMAAWWAAVDSQPPGRATLSGVALLLVAREAREANDVLAARHNAATSAAEVGRAKRQFRRTARAAAVAAEEAAVEDEAEAEALLAAARAASSPQEDTPASPLHSTGDMAIVVTPPPPSIVDVDGGGGYAYTHHDHHQQQQQLLFSTTSTTPQRTTAAIAAGRGGGGSERGQTQQQHSEEGAAGWLTDISSQRARALEGEAPSREAFFCGADMELVGTPRDHSPPRSPVHNEGEEEEMQPVAVDAASQRLHYSAADESSAVVGVNRDTSTAAVHEGRHRASTSKNNSAARKRTRIAVPASIAQPSFTRRRAHEGLAMRYGEDLAVLALEAENTRILLGLPTLPTATTLAAAAANSSNERKKAAASMGTLNGSSDAANISTLFAGDSEAEHPPSAPLETYGQDRRIQTWLEFLCSSFGPKAYASMARYTIATPAAVKAHWYSGAMTEGREQRAAAAALMQKSRKGAADDSNNNNNMFGGGHPYADLSNGRSRSPSAASSGTRAPSGGSVPHTYDALDSSSADRRQQDTNNSGPASVPQQQQQRSSSSPSGASSKKAPPRRSEGSAFAAFLRAAASSGATDDPFSSVGSGAAGMWAAALAANDAHRRQQRRVGIRGADLSTAAAAMLGGSGRGAGADADSTLANQPTPAEVITAGSEEELLLLALCSGLPMVASDAAAGVEAEGNGGGKRGGNGIDSAARSAAHPSARMGRDGRRFRYEGAAVAYGADGDDYDDDDEDYGYGDGAAGGGRRKAARGGGRGGHHHDANMYGSDEEEAPEDGYGFGDGIHGDEEEYIIDANGVATRRRPPSHAGTSTAPPTARGTNANSSKTKKSATGKKKNSKGGHHESDDGADEGSEVAAEGATSRFQRSGGPNSGGDRRYARKKPKSAAAVGGESNDGDGVNNGSRYAAATKEAQRGQPASPLRYSQHRANALGYNPAAFSPLSSGGGGGGGGSLRRGPTHHQRQSEDHYPSSNDDDGFGEDDDGRRRGAFVAAGENGDGDAHGAGAPQQSYRRNAEGRNKSARPPARSRGYDYGDSAGEEVISEDSNEGGEAENSRISDGNGRQKQQRRRSSSGPAPHHQQQRPLLRGRSGFNMNDDNYMYLAPDYAYGPITAAETAREGRMGSSSSDSTTPSSSPYSSSGGTSASGTSRLLGSPREGNEGGQAETADGRTRIERMVGSPLVRDQQQSPSGGFALAVGDDDGNNSTAVAPAQSPPLQLQQHRRAPRPSVAARRGRGTGSASSAVVNANAQLGGDDKVRKDPLLHMTTAVSGFAADAPLVPFGKASAASRALAATNGGANASRKPSNAAKVASAGEDGGAYDELLGTANNGRNKSARPPRGARRGGAADNGDGSDDGAEAEDAFKRAAREAEAAEAAATLAATRRGIGAAEARLRALEDAIAEREAAEALAAEQERRRAKAEGNTNKQQQARSAGPHGADAANASFDAPRSLAEDSTSAAPNPHRRLTAGPADGTHHPHLAKGGPSHLNTSNTNNPPQQHHGRSDVEQMLLSNLRSDAAMGLAGDLPHPSDDDNDDGYNHHPNDDGHGTKGVNGRAFGANNAGAVGEEEDFTDNSIPRKRKPRGRDLDAEDPNAIRTPHRSRAPSANGADNNNSARNNSNIAAARKGSGSNEGEGGVSGNQSANQSSDGSRNNLHDGEDNDADNGVSTSAMKNPNSDVGGGNSSAPQQHGRNKAAAPSRGRGGNSNNEASVAEDDGNDANSDGSPRQHHQHLSSASGASPASLIIRARGRPMALRPREAIEEDERDNILLAEGEGDGRAPNGNNKALLNASSRGGPHNSSHTKLRVVPPVTSIDEANSEADPNASASSAAVSPRGGGQGHPSSTNASALITGRSGRGANSYGDGGANAAGGGGRGKQNKSGAASEGLNRSVFDEANDADGEGNQFMLAAPAGNGSGRRRSGGADSAGELPSAIDIITEANDHMDAHPTSMAPPQGQGGKGGSRRGSRHNNANNDGSGGSGDGGESPDGGNNGNVKRHHRGSNTDNANELSRLGDDGSNGADNDGNNGNVEGEGFNSNGDDSDGGRSLSPGRRRKAVGKKNKKKQRGDSSGAFGEDGSPPNGGGGRGSGRNFASPTRPRRPRAGSKNPSEDGADGGSGGAFSPNTSASRNRRPPRSNSSQRGDRSSRPTTPSSAALNGDRRFPSPSNAAGGDSGRTSPSRGAWAAGRRREYSPHGPYYPDDYLSPKERHSHWLPSGKAEIPDLRRLIAEREERLQKKSLVADNYSSYSPPNSPSNNEQQQRSRSPSRSPSVAPAPTYGL